METTMSNAKVKGYVVREFKDAGTGTTYSPSTKAQTFEAGAYANYKAGGLVSDTPPGAPAAA